MNEKMIDIRNAYTWAIWRYRVVSTDDWVGWDCNDWILGDV